MTFIAPQGVSTEAEVSAKDVARIITQIRKQKIPAVFLENVTDERLLERIGAESGARIGGTLYSDALTDEKGPAPTYLDMMRHNVKQLAAALPRLDPFRPGLSPPWRHAYIRASNWRADRAPGAHACPTRMPKRSPSRC